MSVPFGDSLLSLQFISSMEEQLHSNGSTLKASSGVYESFYQDVFIFALYGFTVLTSIFGNSIVCYVCFVLRPKSPTYLLIGNMAVSDLLSAVAIPLQWIFCSSYLLDANERFCGSFKSLQVVSYFISTFTMAVIAYDRWLYALCTLWAMTGLGKEL